MQFFAEDVAKRPVHVSVGLTKVVPGSIWGEIIDRATGNLGYCHAFLYFHWLDMVWEAHIDFGVRFKTREIGSNEILVPLENVDFEGARHMLRIACGFAGDKYDHKGVVAYKIPFVKENPDDKYCSEGVVLVGQRGYGLFSAMDAGKTPPNALALVLHEAGLKGSNGELILGDNHG